MIRNLISSILNLGVEPGDSPDVRIRKAILSASGITASLALTLLIGPVYFYFDEPGAGWIYSGYGIFTLVNIGFFAFWHRDHVLTVSIIAFTALPAHWLVAVLLGGFSESHGILLWGIFFPVLGSLIFFSPRQTLFWFAVFSLGVTAVVLADPWLRASNNVPPGAASALTLINVILVTTQSLGILLYFVNQRDVAYRLLDAEREKSESLLLNILPAAIAARLKQEGRTIADHYPSVSVLFADIVGFTPLSAALAPAALIGHLNEIFSYFDDLARKYGVEKIRTIGDGYMVAAGVPEPRQDHAQQLARMALEMLSYVSDQGRTGLPLQLRIGLNSGPAIAGIIGTTKFHYDIWGDAVNVAARMESHGVPGRIQLARGAHDLISADFECEPRGVIEVKGKGSMETWFLVGEKEASTISFANP